MDYGPSLWIDKSTKRNINEDLFLRILASIVVEFFNEHQTKKVVYI